MSAEPLELRLLRPGDERSFKAAVQEFGRETPPWQFAFGFDQNRPFSDYIAELERHSRGIDIRDDFVPNTFFVGIVAEIVVGRLSLRHQLNPGLEIVGGHIGYGVVPSKRKNGYAKAMLEQAIPLCARQGIARALITCDDDNIASQKVVEACGGIFEGTIECRERKTLVRRYWLPIPSSDRVGLQSAP